MTTLRYVTCDVFTDRRFGGNPLAVVLDAEDPSVKLDRAIAALTTDALDMRVIVWRMPLPRRPGFTFPLRLPPRVCFWALGMVTSGRTRDGTPPPAGPRSDFGACRGSRLPSSRHAAPCSPCRPRLARPAGRRRHVAGRLFEESLLPPPGPRTCGPGDAPHDGADPRGAVAAGSSHA